MQKCIAIDMDEVMADTLGARLERYAKDYGVTLTRDSFHGKKFYEVLPEEHRQQARDVLDEVDFFRHLDVMEGAQEVIKSLSERYEIVIATAAMEVPFSFRAKFEWLEEYFPFLDPHKFIFCGNKGVVLADYLIDDNPKQLGWFQGEGLMFSSPSNALITNFNRVENWQAVADLFL